MGQKAKINYIVDVIILVLFVLSAFSGLGLMQPKEDRMMMTATVMDENRVLISDVHILTSFLMVAGVMVHLVLHRRWMAVMTRNIAQQQERTNYVRNTAEIVQEH